MQFRTIDEGLGHRRELWIDDETKAAHLWVFDLSMRIGSAEVRMAGIGDVYTERAHRMKGYMRHLYEDTVQYMIDGGYDVSMLFGIPNFYTKFGYAASLPKPTFTIQTRDAEAAVSPVVLGASRPIEPADIPRVLELHNRENAERTGTLVRRVGRFEKFQGTHWDRVSEAVLWEDAGGALLAYAVWDRRPTEVTVGELGVRDPSLLPALLQVFAQQAVEKRCSEITFFLPPDHAFSEYAQQFGVTWHITYSRYSDAMMRILNQQPLFEKLLPVLSGRLARRSDIHPPESLSLMTGLGVTTLGFEGAKVILRDRVAAPVTLSLPQDRLVQLVMGYRSARDILNSNDGVLAGIAASDLVPLLDVLFPKGTPFMWTSDYF